MIYDYKSDKIVQDVIFEYYHPFIEDIADEYDSLRRNEFLLIYAPSYIAREIYTRIFSEVDSVWINEEADTKLLVDDDNEVIITISVDGMVFIEEARGNSGQLKYGDGVVNYVYDGFKQKEIEKLASDDCPVLIFGFEEDEIENDDTDLSITANMSQYYVNGKEVDKKTWEKEYKSVNDDIEAFKREYWDNWLKDWF